jgi:hypothetical protein
MLDEQAFGEASQLISETIERLHDIEKDAKQRLRQHEGEVPSVFIAMLFDAPSDPAAQPDAAPARRRAKAKP